MPDCAINRITAPKETIDRLVGTDAKGQPWADFRRIIPEPECLSRNGDVGIHVWTAAKRAVGTADSWENERRHQAPYTAEEVDQIAACIRAHEECGHVSWYDWSIANWGTKWNGMATERVSDTVVKFESAWNPPEPVIKELWRQSGRGDFLHEWVMEFGADRAGRIEAMMGEDRLRATDLTGTRAALNLLYELQPEMRIATFDGNMAWHHGD